MLQDSRKQAIGLGYPEMTGSGEEIDESINTKATHRSFLCVLWAFCDDNDFLAHILEQ